MTNLREFISHCGEFISNHPFLIEKFLKAVDRDCKVLLTLDGDPDVLGIGPLAPFITRQCLGGCGELFRLGSCIHVINMTLQVLG